MFALECWKLTDNVTGLFNLATKMTIGPNRFLYPPFRLLVEGVGLHHFVAFRAN